MMSNWGAPARETRRRKGELFVVAVMVAMCAAVVPIAAIPTIARAQGAAAAEPRSFDIPAQPLTEALIQFGRQAGLQASADPGLIGNLRSAPVDGTMPWREALTTLLSGTGLTYRLTGSLVTLERAVVQPESGPVRLDPIIVEGEKSGRPLRETPASVVVLGGEEVDKPENPDIRTVADQVPNVVFDRGGSLPTIRGIDGSADQVGGGGLATGAQPRVNIIVDDVARPVNLGGAIPTLTSLWDTEQVEVARGPQSTLGGRNSLGGNIRVSTKDPVYELEGALRGFYFDEQGTVGGAGMLNLPLIEGQAALRVTAEASEGESFADYTNPMLASVRDTIEDEEARKYRAKLLITPTEIPDLELMATYEHSERFEIIERIVDDGSFDFSGANNFSLPFDNNQDVFALEGRYFLSDSVIFEARGSYLDNRSETPPELALLALPFTLNTDSLAGEALLRIEGLSFVNRAVLGVAYEKQEEDGRSDPVSFPVSFEGEIENIGIFGEIEFGLTDRLALIAGGRLEFDDRSRSLQAFGSLGELDIADTAFIPKAGLRYAVTEDITVGYQYSEGWRAGGLDFDFLDPSAQAVTYGPERLRQHEIYTRSTFLDGRAGLNATAFYYTFVDPQLPGAGGISVNGTGLFGNVPEARGFGLELDGFVEIVEGLTATAGLGLLDTEITDAGPSLQEFEGEELPRSPDLTFNLGLSYLSPVGFDASARLRHVGSSDLVAIGQSGQASYTVVDFSAGYEFEIDEDYSFRIDAFVNNVFDERVVLNPLDPIDSEVVDRPRTIGIGATFRF